MSVDVDWYLGHRYTYKVIFYEIGMSTYLKTINPYTEELIKAYPSADEESLNRAVEAGHHAFMQWRENSYDDRGNYFLRLATSIKERIQELAIIMANEMGKPVSAGRAEIEKCAWVCEYYAEMAEQYLQPQIINTNFSKTTVYYEPLGVVFGVMPWNFPFWQVFRSAVPTIMAGNTFLLKHAPISLGVAAVIEQLFTEAGFPSGVFQQLVLDNQQSARLIAHPSIIGLTFTGSERTGRILGALAGAQLKRMVLELGGADPYLVLEDADVSAAAQAIVSSRLNNCGQVCIAAKRVIVVDSVMGLLQAEVMRLMEEYTMGNPLEESTKLGPMARCDLRKALHEQVVMSIQKGARAVMGAELPERKGFFYPPTLLTQVMPGMPAFDEELFGPVLVLINAKNEEEAIKLANLSSYGLGAAVFTEDIKRGERIARKSIAVGSCFVNATVSSDPRVPFGGIKNSGLGRELGREGILEFMNIKTVSIR